MLEAYKNLPIKSFADWFTELAEIAAKSDDSSSLPKLELILKKGGIVRGHILKEEKVGKHNVLMIAGLSDSYNKPEVTFIPSRTVAGLTLLEPDLYLKQYVIPAASKAIGNLELKRAVKESGEKLSKVTDGKITLSADVENCPETARFDLLQIAESIPGIFEKLTGDELGRSVVYDNVTSVNLEVSKEAKTALDQKQLKIQITSPSSKPLSAEKERIIGEIEALF